MKILITNTQLDHRTGTEIVVRDLEGELRRRGHSVCVYTRRPGCVSDEIAAAGGTVVTSLDDVPFRPDVIHGQHHVETVEAVLHFPRTPAIFVCHDRLQYADLPPRLPQIVLYVAVDANCRERLIAEAGVDERDIRLIHNAVDVERFSTIADLEPTPRRVAVFGNNAAAGGYLDEIQRACRVHHIEPDVFGSGVENTLDAPEATLPRYDLVFAKARCALEALAAGCAVILADVAGLGGMVTFDDASWMRDWNFGARCLQQRLTAGAVLAEMARYDTADSIRVTSWIRSHASIRACVDQYEAAYADAVSHAVWVSPTVGSWRDAYQSLAEQTGGLERLLRLSDAPFLIPSLPPAVAAQLTVSITSPRRVVTKGEVFTVDVVVHNHSSEHLGSFGSKPVNLCYHWLQNGSEEMLHFEGRRTTLTTTIRAGHSHAQKMVVEAPAEYGQAVLRVTLVQEGVRWFDELYPPVITDTVVTIEAPHPDHWTLGEIAAVAGLDVQRDAEIDNLGFVSQPLPNMLTFAENESLLKTATRCAQLRAVIVPDHLAAAVPDGVGLVISSTPKQTFALIHRLLVERTSFYGIPQDSCIHPRARIHPTASIDRKGVRIAEGVEIGPHAVIRGPADIEVGTRVEAGVVIGSAGFQTIDEGDHLSEMEHVGGVTLGRDCVVLANSVIARGLFRQNTTIADSCRIGNGAFVSHNCVIAERSFIGHGAILNGSVHIGRNAWIGPGSTIANDLTIGEDARVSLGCTVISDVPPGQRVTGPAAADHWVMMRANAELRSAKRRTE